MTSQDFVRIVAECRQVVLDAILRYVANAELSYAMREKARRIEVVLTTRKSTRAGVFKLLRRRQAVTTRIDGSLTMLGWIEVNTMLCNTEERFRSTLLHELSHAVVAWSGARSFDGSHGTAWRTWQTALGADPKDVKHDYDMDEAFAAKGGYYVRVGCANGHVHQVTPSKAARVLRGGYVCGTCKRLGLGKENRVYKLDNTQKNKETK